MTKPLVTVVVPVYNAQETLGKCVDSILHQTYENLEVILVSDGSTDDSLAICRSYEAADPRVKVADMPNRGVSAARNIGIELANGEFLQFADSDDYLEPDMTRLMVERACADASDLVITDFYRVINTRMADKGNIRDGGVLSKKEFAEYFLKSPADYYYGVMWNKLYRRSILLDYGIRCCTEMKWCEDLLFNLDYYRYAESFSAISKPLYYYVRNKKGLCASNSDFRSSIAVKRALFASYKAVFESAEIYDRHKLAIRKFFIASARDGGVFIGTSIPSLEEKDENAPISRVDWRLLLEKIQSAFPARPSGKDEGEDGQKEKLRERG